MIFNIKWVRALVFFTLAIVISNIFRFNVFLVKDYLNIEPVWFYLISISFLEGSGILIGVLVVILLLYKRERIKISLFGTSVKYSLLMLVVPLSLFLIIGVDNEYDMDKHLYGLLSFTSTFLYCILEESGWRGYLQGEFKEMKSWRKFTLIGFMWYLWHLPFLTNSDFFSNILFLGLLIFGSWGIGQVLIATKSIVACACFHLVVQIISFNSLIKDGLNINAKLIILAICITSWIIILKRWEKITLSKGVI
ncbi:type II CAAX prenyl endopeptidase Rce1 family protein [Myroides odoratus]|uniref:CPBP family glutamic-type intramembrane protease n=1 Tax=Myroides odoratus TaxID=256 RepID=UPI0039AEE351